MTRRVGSVAVFLLAAVCIVAAVGCAATMGSETSSNPELIRKEIEEIDNDILNAEEMYKASLTQLQMEESTALRREVNRLWVEQEHLRSRKAALEQRLAELEAEEKK